MALMHVDTAFFGPSNIWTGQWASHQKCYDSKFLGGASLRFAPFQVGNPAISLEDRIRI